MGERTLQPEFENELRPELPIAQRCKMLKELGDMHLHNITLDEVSRAGTCLLTIQFTELFYCETDLDNKAVAPNQRSDCAQQTR